MSFPLLLMPMDLRFVVRGLCVALPAAVVASVAWLLLQTPLLKPVEPAPPPPTILAPRGPLPADPVGLQEWAHYRGQGYQRVGCGFLLSLGGQRVVGVTTAHSVTLGEATHRLETIALRVSGQTSFLGDFDTLWGQPGRPFTMEDMTVDYLLLKTEQPLDSSLVLEPDPRGGPQPGERLSLFHGLGDQRGDHGVLEGTVHSATDIAVWVLMDHWFNPSQMSGSPFVSQHTGKVVGMAVAASPRRNGLLLAVHPIGSLIQRARTAVHFPKIAEVSPGETRLP